MALGAQPRSILSNVLLEGLVIACLGVAAGIVLGFAGARGLGNYIAEIQVPGVMTFAGAAAMILAAAVIASAVPAMRAAKVDPVVALRSE